METGPDELSTKNLNDIYIFTGITVATIVLTLGRSFMFFNVSQFGERSNLLSLEVRSI